MRNLALLVLVLFTGCTSVEFVRKDLTPVKQAVLRYPPQSDASGEAEHRAEMTKKANEFCGGDFKIVKEYEALEKNDDSGMRTGIGTGFGMGGSAIFIGGSSGSSERMYHFVEVACASAAP